MKRKATYLLPIWIDVVCHGDPKDILIDFNEKLTEFLEKYGDAVVRNSNSINIKWSVNQQINLNG